MNYMPKIRKVMTALQIKKGIRYVIDTRQSWSKWDKPFKIYIVNRIYTREEYIKAFPEKFKKRPFKYPYKKVSEYESSKQYKLLIYLVDVLKGGERSE